ncbi:hypothetical protein CHS0354_023743 [Potamilus streckersoni]|uniref:Uncharacterized protein n=1 Tax=Potamilus streckersoni TaxID=2493646 RepID=A0AAE0RYX5_9BIVA|nr:hypothetical protein CHS0354_023743 [Potamilus streckersoni]
MKVRKVLSVLFLVVAGLLASQSAAKAQLKPLTFSLEKDSAGKDTRWIRFLFLGQFQANIPLEDYGTGVGGFRSKNEGGSLQFLARRMRFLTLVQASPDDVILFHIGVNNQGVASGGAPGEPTGPGKKPQLFIHDFTYDRRLVSGPDGSLFLGAGLNYWNGLNRYSSASGLNFVGIDLLFEELPFIETTDQCARKFGLYAKGNISSLLYRISLDFPFQPAASATVAPSPAGLNPTGFSAAALTALAPILPNVPFIDITSVGDIAYFNPAVATKMIQGYFAWNFFDKEVYTIPYTVGTYLGARKVFNVGAGFFVFPDGMLYKKSVSQVTAEANVISGLVAQNRLTSEQANQFLLLASKSEAPKAVTSWGASVDVYADIPLGEKAADGVFTGYLMYQYLYMGPNYYRPVGDAALIVTGHSFLAQASYITGSYLPVKLGIYAQFTGVIPQVEGNILTSSYFAKLRENGMWISYEGGLSWFISGHGARITVAYRASSRSVFGAAGVAGTIKHSDMTSRIFAQFTFAI